MNQIALFQKQHAEVLPWAWPPVRTLPGAGGGVWGPPGVRAALQGLMEDLDAVPCKTMECWWSGAASHEGDTRELGTRMGGREKTAFPCMRNTCS